MRDAYAFRMQKARFASLVLSILLVLVTLPVYFTIGGLSVMNLDAPSPTAQMWVLFIVTIALCVLLPLLSLIVSMRFIHRQKFLLGLGVSLIPAIALGALWLWLLTQSFS